jgi:benzoyl-CoA reductase subunit D
MIAAGIDSGSKYTKVIFADENGKILGRKISLSGYDQNQNALRLIDELCMELGVKREEIKQITATGTGRNSISFTNGNVTDIRAAAKAVHVLYPEARTVIEVGAEESKAVRLDAEGRITDSAANEKCAAGSGSFTESMARTLEMSMKDFAEKSLESDKKIPMNAQCTVFAESEVVSLIHSGTDKKDIAKAVHDAIASRVSSMARRVRIEPEVVLIGGLVHNAGFVASLKANLQLDNLILAADPEFVGAYGAALSALEGVNVE